VSPAGVQKVAELASGVTFAMLTTVDETDTPPSSWSR